MKNKSLNKYCLDCNKIIKSGLRCYSCSKKGELSHQWKGGLNRLPKCIDCGKRLSRLKLKRCKSCTNKKLSKELSKRRSNTVKKIWNNPTYRQKLKGALVKHHIYGKTQNETIILTKRFHMKIHQEAYFYIYETQGKKGIDKYIKWFKQKYKGILTK